MRRIRLGAWLAALVGLFVAAMTALAYSTGQAEAGRQVFTNVCTGCHGTGLQGGVGPGLVGPAFRTTWNTALALFQFASREMPLGSPGSLSREQYWNVVAYLLQRNGIAADEQPLNEETAEQIRLRQVALSFASQNSTGHWRA